VWESTNDPVEAAYEQLLVAGARRVVSTATIPRPSNAISIAPVLATAAADPLRHYLLPRDRSPTPSTQ